MSLFGKNKCQKFFKYSSKKVNIKGLSSALEKSGSKIDLSLGEIAINPEYSEVSNTLMKLDILQYSICQNINKLDSKSREKEKLISEHVQICQEMMLIALNQEKHDHIQEKQNPDGSDSTDTYNDNFELYDLMTKSLNLSDIKELCFKLNIDIENFEGPNKNSIVRELVSFYSRRDKIDTLKTTLSVLRPDMF